MRTTSADVLAVGPPALCRYTTTETVRCSQREVEALLATARGRLEECAGSNTGKLTIRVEDRGGGKVAFGVEPDPSLDPLARQCVLDALTESNTSDNPTLWTGGAGIPPSGFTSHLRIEWGD